MSEGHLGTLPREDLQRAIRGLEHKLSKLSELTAKYQRERDKGRQVTSRLLIENTHLKDAARNVVRHVELIAADVRAAGDFPLVRLSEEGVTPEPFTLADELWLSAAPLRLLLKASDDEATPEPRDGQS